MGGACSMQGGDGKCHTILFVKPEGKGPIGRPRRKWEDYIRLDPRGIASFLNIRWCGVAHVGTAVWYEPVKVDLRQCDWHAWSGFRRLVKGSGYGLMKTENLWTSRRAVKKDWAPRRFRSFNNFLSQSVRLWLLTAGWNSLCLPGPKHFDAVGGRKEVIH
jgi:hypothetical protein